MAEAGPGLLPALEQSGIGAAIRQSVWIYPAANTAHIAALVIEAGAVAIMDPRLLGTFAAARPADVVRPARRLVIITALLTQIAAPRALYGRGEPCVGQPGFPGQAGASRPGRGECAEARSDA